MAVRRVQERMVARVVRELMVQVALKDLDYDWASLKRLRRHRKRVMADGDKLLKRLAARGVAWPQLYPERAKGPAVKVAGRE